MNILSLSPKRKSIKSVKSEVRKIRQRTRRQAMLYGDTAAEKASRENLIETARTMVRSLWMSRKGRRIDLLALLTQKRQDGKPLWALVDPAHKPGGHIPNHNCLNGEYEPGKGLTMPCNHSQPKAQGWCVKSRTYLRVDMGDLRLCPTSIPPLPPKARKIVTDKRIRRRAKWVGLLYQPESWMETRPDPAIVVEWHDRPGEYYALCVWGQDGPGIMEFVD